MSKSIIKACDLSMDFPLYHFGARSFKKSLVSAVSKSRVSLETGRLNVQSLRNMSFQFTRGDRVALFGPNGSGKTTLLRTIAGIMEPTSGQLEVSGTIGALIDVGAGVDHHATGWENIDLFLLHQGIDGHRSDILRAEIAKNSGLGEFLSMPVRLYSSGMGVRLTFAMETIVEPQILLMDEWLSAGDDEFTKYCEKRLQELVSQSNILVIATHNRDIINKFCNRVLMLKGGEIVEDRMLDKGEEF